MVNLRTIYGLVLRHIFLFVRSPIRSVELIFWPIVDLMVWGYLTVYLQTNTSGDFPQFISFLIGAMIFWDILFRAQQGVAISFLEDVWTRNLLNVFVAPIRMSEFMLATFVVGFLRCVLVVIILSVFSWFLYQFDFLVFEFALIPFAINLLMFGWTLGMVSTALIVRWGMAAESLAWAVPFFIQPLVAVFYPVSVLPEFIQTIAWWIPCTHVFEGMRGVLANDGIIDWNQVALATGLNVVFMIASAAFFSYMMRTARERGLLAKVATH